MAAAAAAAAAAAVPDYSAAEAAPDRLQELLKFDATKSGVKGLADAGITKLPRIFVHSPDDLPSPPSLARLQVPVIDLSGVADDARRRKEAVEQIRDASSSWGFFQLVNHGVPPQILEGMMQGSQRFHELPKEVKAKLYGRDLKQNVKYVCNYDLFLSRAANWRDTFSCTFDATLNPQDIPDVCRDEILAYGEHMLGLAESVYELLSEALGLSPSHLKSINLSKGQFMSAHYYPPCPEPELTLGTSKHCDPSFLTLLIEDELGGLQVRHEGHWVDVSPVPGAVVVNIGDLLQIISNGKFKSVEHRVLASRLGPRLSVAMFFVGVREANYLFGPIKEILSENEAPKYREFLLEEYFQLFASRGIGTESILSHFTL
ncbi:1-aminocyclopropane-1-carboxylate oxidase homolog 3-like [Zingiber officinale]|uniref:1-aminocyclopropane-1-carboxylate oxidase homolog 3-like n=1 Tax=Zingiber officinale TaxID=94328 RepID=UPI001C4BB1B6|nr:1-aminocyclopropane-1-carboxylate oxidase homolog 3-like [Zingiber officinale]